MKKTILISFIFTILFVIFPQKSFAIALSEGCSSTDQIHTAIGCLDYTGKETISQLLNWAIILAGGIAFILILVASFQITTAQGDAKKAAAARELITSALSGLILIVISVVLLNLIGVNVLGLDQFGFNL